jgi:signal transduction histidine kinase
MMAASFNGCSALSAIAVTALLTLSICRSIIEAHEVRIWASRNAGLGANPRLGLPLRARMDHEP